MKQAGMKFDDVEYWEINGPLPAISGLRIRERKYGINLDLDKCNHNGSGIAWDTISSTGLRIIITMYYEMEKLGLTLGGASLCVGTGPAMASRYGPEISNIANLSMKNSVLQYQPFVLRKDGVFVT